LFDQKQLKSFGNHSIVKNFDMSKLEIEYDYDTDNEQMMHSKKMMLHELVQAIQFYVLDDPIKLVDNIMIWHICAYTPTSFLTLSLWLMTRGLSN
jgi:hypothetical protein